MVGSWFLPGSFGFGLPLNLIGQNEDTQDRQHISNVTDIKCAGSDTQAFNIDTQSSAWS